MKFRESVENALRSPRPLDELRAVARDLLAIGIPRQQAFELFDHTRLELRRAGREDDEDAVADAMDFIDGWSSAHMKLAAPPESRVFVWTYPVFYIKQGASCAALAGPEANGKTVAAIAVFTDAAFAEQFIRAAQFIGTAESIDSADAFWTFLQRIPEPATLVAFNPPVAESGHIIARVCVPVSTLLAKLRDADTSIETHSRELVIATS